MEQSSLEQSAEIENLRNVIKQMQTDFEVRIQICSKELASARDNHLEMQKLSSDCMGVLKQIYERLMSASNLVRPIIEAALKGATDSAEVHSISSNESMDESAQLDIMNVSSESTMATGGQRDYRPAQVHGQPSAQPNIQPMAPPNVQPIAQPNIQPRMQEPIPSGSGVAPTVNAADVSAEVSALLPQLFE